MAGLFRGSVTRLKAVGFGFVVVVGTLAGAAIVSPPAGAATTVFVAPTGSGGGSCASPDFNTISAAVTGAASGDTINVCPGTYTEMVHVTGEQLTINGSAGATPAVINASGLSNGVVVEGAAAAGTVITGFTVQNAQNEGILVEGTTNVTVSNNVVNGNDLACIPQTSANDCGEGIHLEAVTNSSVSRNTSENNTGGILLDDGIPPGSIGERRWVGRPPTSGRRRATTWPTTSSSTTCGTAASRCRPTTRTPHREGIPIPPPEGVFNNTVRATSRKTTAWWAVADLES